MEEEIKRQFFPNAVMAVKFYERFHLSAQYTSERLTDAYRDSILAKLKAYSPVEYSLFKNADLTFEEDGVLLEGQIRI